MKLFTYLEYMTANERKNAAIAGQTNLMQQSDQPTTVIKEEPLPKWFHEDYWTPTIPGVKKPTRSQMIKSLSKNCKIASQIPLQIKNKQTYRAVITIDGQILYCDEIDGIHQPLVSFGMCLGDIPMKEEFSAYNWRKDSTTMNYFIAIEVSKKHIKLSESYLNNTGQTIIDKLTQYNKQYSHYYKAIGQLGFDVEDLE